MKKSIIDWWWRGASLNSTYSTYFSALPTGITGTVKTAQNAFCVSLQASGLLSRMKAGYFFHAGGVGNAKINLANPATYTLTSPAGDPTFSEGNGCASNGSTYFLNPFKTNEYAGIETNHAFCIYVSQSDTTSSGALILHGATIKTTTLESIEIRPLITGNVRFNNWSAVNSNATNGTSNHKHLYVQTVDSSNQYMYVDGTKTTVASAPVAGNISTGIPILAANMGGITGFYTKNVACYFIFDKFTDTDESNFRTAFNTYKTAVGLP